MGNDIKKCQNKETYEDCTSKLFSSILSNECKCTSYSKGNFSKPGQVFALKLCTQLKPVFDLIANLFAQQMCIKYLDKKEDWMCYSL